MELARPYLPSFTKYASYLEGVYARCQLTNHGPLVAELTRRLEDYLDVRHLVLVCNGSAALDLAYHALGIAGSLVTTPFSFVASSSVAAWNGIRPVFADIDPDTWNIDPAGLERAVYHDTTAIAPVHVYGNPADDLRISAIARKHGLKVVYDAAHCFGTRVNGKSVLDMGDASAISFHATKTFHTVEGGAVIFRDADILHRAQGMINFGFQADGGIASIGTNLKMSEVHAAMGLAVLDDIDLVLDHRRSLIERYLARLNSYVQCQCIGANVTNGGGYMPVVLPTRETCEHVALALADQGIKSRRYFHPPIDTIPSYASPTPCPISQDLAGRILCLPLHFDLTPADVERVCDAVLAALPKRSHIAGTTLSGVVKTT